MKGLASGIRQLAGLVSRERRQYHVYAGLAVAALGLAAAAYFSDNLVFHRLLGTVNPFAIVVPLIAVGFILVSVQLSRGWFAVIRKGTIKGVLLSAGLAVVLGGIVILIDLQLRYPEGMNVAFPLSLAYYPSVAFFAEIVLHLLPLTLIAVLLTSLFRGADIGRIIWIAVIVASLSDPAFQIFDAAANHSPLPTVLVTAGHVFVVNFLMLVIFRKFDLVSVVSFRLFYYIIWHIVWGAIRLGVLFQ